MLLLAATVAWTEQRPAIPAGVYLLTTETILPHLEEALRYSTVKAERCLRDQPADAFFPLLQQQAFTGCSLVPGQDAHTFVLRCRNPEAATGLARFEASPTTFSAVLELKMGGKNMTLLQRVSGPRISACE